MKSQSKQNIAYLIEQCAHGNRLAQYRIYLIYSDMIYTICKRYIGNHVEAEEVLHDAFVKAFGNIKKLKQKEKFGSWLKKITIHQCINHLKRRKITFENLEIDENTFNNVPFTDDEPLLYDSEKIKNAVDQLPEGCRTVLNLHLVEEFKHKEIATMLNISESTSKSQYRRALQLLKEILTNHEKSI